MKTKTKARNGTASKAPQSFGIERGSIVATEEKRGTERWDHIVRDIQPVLGLDILKPEDMGDPNTVAEAMHATLFDSVFEWMKECDLRTLATIARMAHDGAHRKPAPEAHNGKVGFVTPLVPGMRVEAQLHGSGPVYGTIVEACQHGAFVQVDEGCRCANGMDVSSTDDGIIAVLTEYLCAVVDPAAGAPTRKPGPVPANGTGAATRRIPGVRSQARLAADDAGRKSRQAR